MRGNTALAVVAGIVRIRLSLELLVEYHRAGFLVSADLATELVPLAVIAQPALDRG
jgi:hypothetical protein